MAPDTELDLRARLRAAASRVAGSTGRRRALALAQVRRLAGQLGLDAVGLAASVGISVARQVEANASKP